jgi:hypothetical protein
MKKKILSLILQDFSANFNSVRFEGKKNFNKNLSLLPYLIIQ